MALFDENRDALSVSAGSRRPATDWELFLIHEGASVTFVPVLIVATVLGFIAARTTTLAARAGWRSSPPLALLSLLASLSVLAIVAWGVLAVSWYWPVLALIIGALASAAVVRPSTIVPLTRARPMMEGLTIAAAAFLWLWVRLS